MKKRAETRAAEMLRGSKIIRGWKNKVLEQYYAPGGRGAIAALERLNIAKGHTKPVRKRAVSTEPNGAKRLRSGPI